MKVTFWCFLAALMAAGCSSGGAISEDESVEGIFKDVKGNAPAQIKSKDEMERNTRVDGSTGPANNAPG